MFFPKKVRWWQAKGGPRVQDFFDIPKLFTGIHHKGYDDNEKWLDGYWIQGEVKNCVGQ